MAARAVSAGRSWLTPLAVLVPILATLAAAAWAVQMGSEWLGLLVLGGGFGATTYLGHLTYGALTSLRAAILTLLAAGLALPMWYLISINSPICDKTVDNAWEWLPVTGGALVFFALGSLGFRSHRGAWVTPLAFLAGVLAVGLLYAVVPGTQGTCET